MNIKRNVCIGLLLTGSIAFSGCKSLTELSNGIDVRSKGNVSIQVHYESPHAQGFSDRAAAMNKVTLVHSGMVKLIRINSDENTYQYENMTLKDGKASALIEALLTGNYKMDVRLYDKSHQVIYKGSSDFYMSADDDLVVNVAMIRQESDLSFEFDVPKEENEDVDDKWEGMVNQ